MKRQVPLILCFAFGIVMILTQFSPHSFSQGIYEEVISWTLIISPFALVLATATPDSNSRRAHSTSHRSWQYSFNRVCGTHHNGGDRCSVWSAKYGF